MKRTIGWILYLMVMLAGCTSMSTARLERYYGEQSNFVTVTGTVSHIQYDEEGTALHIGVEECPESFSDTAFKLVGEGLAIAQENGIDEALQIGNEIAFTAAPRYFGDGYVIPLAAIEVDGVWLLEFDEGHAALMDWLN